MPKAPSRKKAPAKKKPKAVSSPRKPQAKRGTPKPKAVKAKAKAKTASSAAPPKAKTPAYVVRRPLPEGAPEARVTPYVDPGRHAQPDLDWDDDGDRRTPVATNDAVVLRWVSRAEELLEKLRAHDIADHEVRADLAVGRFVWIGRDGEVSAEARARVICSWARSTSVVAMGWADPLVREASVPRVDNMAAERDDVDEEGAWRIAMEAADGSGADYLYRLPTPHASYFLALQGLTFAPSRLSFNPSTPVGLVLRGLSDTRKAIVSRSEPSEIVRERLLGVGRELLHQAEYAYRDTDWVARLERTGNRLLHLSSRLARPTYSSVVAGVRAEDWISIELAKELSDVLELLEDEWSAFA